MGYGGRTKFLHIPYPKTGEQLLSRSEQERMQIIDTQLHGAIRAHSGGHGCVAKGDFSSNGTIVYLDSLDCFINQIYGYSDDTVEWNTLTSGLNYLFVVRNLNTIETGEVDSLSNTDGVVPTGGLLIATAISTGSAISVIDENPSGSIKCPSWQNHIDDNDNPHTSILYQDEMICSGVTVLVSADIEDLEVDTLTVRQQLTTSGLLTDSLVATSFYADNLYAHDLVGVNAQFSGTAVLNELVVTSGITFGGGHLKGNMRVDSGVTIDGVDLDVLETDFDNHAANMSNPHGVTAVQAAALPLAGGNMTGPIGMGSGLTVDGVDLSTLTPLINDSNCDYLHTHMMSGIPERYLMYAPEFCNGVLSGLGSGIVSTGFDPINFHNYYEWMPHVSNDTCAAVIRHGVKEDFSLLTKIRFWHRLRNILGLPFSNSKIKLDVYNTNDTLVASSGWVPNGGGWVEAEISMQSGLGTLGEYATSIFTMSAMSGETCQLGEYTLEYDTIYKE